MNKKLFDELVAKKQNSLRIRENKEICDADIVTRKNFLKIRAIRTVSVYGTEIFVSDEFAAACLQKHHRKTNIGVHSIHVACLSVYLYDRYTRKPLEEDRRMLAEACLCHDLGIVEIKKEKAGLKRMFMAYTHPICSAKIAKQLLPQISEKESNIIKNHMFPLSLGLPKSKLAWILILVDKFCAFTETLFGDAAYPFHK